MQIYPSRRRPIQQGRYYYPLILEFAFSPQKKPYFRYSSSGTDELSKHIFELSQLLSICTQFFFFGAIKSKEPIKKLTKRNLPKMDKKSIRWYQDKSLDDRTVTEVVVPEFIDLFFDAYYSSTLKKRNTFQRAAYLFYAGIEVKKSYPSLSFACLVSAIETLMDYEKFKPKVCSECNQKAYKISKRFRQFVYEHAYENKETQTAKKFINRVYGSRSKILHSGKLLIADLLKDIANDSVATKRWRESFLHKDLITVTRICLINWLIKSTTFVA